MTRGELERASADQLYRLARQALTVAGGRGGADVLGEHPYWTLGTLRQVVDALDPALTGLARELVSQAHSGELVVVEGPFAGDTVAAAATARRWLNSARTMLSTGPGDAIDSAHIAIAGIAAAQ